MERIVDLMVNSSGSSILESTLITTGYVLLPQSISQIAGRYLLLVVAVSALVSIMKRKYVFLALPALALLGAGYLTMHLLSGSDMWLALRTIAPGYLIGFPLAASTIYDYAFHKRPALGLKSGRRKILLLLFCGTLLLTYVMFAYNNERYFVVSQVQMTASSFVGQSLEKMEKVGLCSFVHPPLEVYYLSPTKMPVIVPMSDREFKYADLILVDETWFSDSTTPDMPRLSQTTIDIRQFVETRLDRVYSNSYVRIYVNPMPI